MMVATKLACAHQRHNRVENDFHKTELLVSEWRGERSAWITKPFTGVKTIQSMRTQGAAYLCLKRGFQQGLPYWRVSKAIYEFSCCAFPSPFYQERLPLVCTSSIPVCARREVTGMVDAYGCRIYRKILLVSDRHRRFSLFLLFYHCS